VVLLDFAVCLPKEAETVWLVRTVVKGGLRTFGVTQDCIDDICLALSEACTNVVDHAVLDDEYEVRLQVDEYNCAISVKNTDENFDASGLEDVMPSATSPRGRGVAIMRAVMDQVAFDPEPAAGTIVNLVKGLSVEPDGLIHRLRRKKESGSLEKGRAVRSRRVSR
jgi:serine/threonine-protein kinase RsbW